MCKKKNHCHWVFVLELTRWQLTVFLNYGSIYEPLNFIFRKLDHRLLCLKS